MASSRPHKARATPPPLPADAEAERHLAQLRGWVRGVQGRGLRSLRGEDLAQFPAMYRYAVTRLSKARTAGQDSPSTRALGQLIAGAHGILYRDLAAPPEGRLRRAVRFLMYVCPSAIRAEWPMLATSLALFYGLALIAYVLVANNLELAFTLLDGNVLRQEFAQLQAVTPEAPFRGNFTFGLDQSASTAGALIANNTWVAVLLFTSALIPPLYALVLVLNGLMIGTYLGVASHWAQGGNILSIIMCHGVLELQALALSGAAGLVLARGLFRPGVWTRSHAMRLESARAWRLFAPVLAMLVGAGLIEAYVSPHAPLGVRLACMIISVAALGMWLCLSSGTKALQAKSPD